MNYTKILSISLGFGICTTHTHAIMLPSTINETIQRAATYWKGSHTTAPQWNKAEHELQILATQTDHRDAQLHASMLLARLYYTGGNGLEKNWQKSLELYERLMHQERNMRYKAEALYRACVICMESTDALVKNLEKAEQYLFAATMQRDEKLFQVLSLIKLATKAITLDSQQEKGIGYLKKACEFTEFPVIVQEITRLLSEL